MLKKEERKAKEKEFKKGLKRMNEGAGIQSSNTPVDFESNEVLPQLSSIPEVGTQETSTPAEDEAEAEAKQSSPNKRGLTSEAWVHFKRAKLDNKWKAICKFCDKKLGGDTRNGTKHLHDHIKICKLRNVRPAKQSMLKTIAEGPNSAGEKCDSLLVGNYTFNQEEPRVALAKAIVFHEYPLAMVEHIMFRRFMGSVQPLFKMISRNTIKIDILKMYEIERAKTLKLLEKNSSRIAITTDMWTSTHQNKGYMAVTAHYIDANWCLQNRLVRFIYVPAPHTAETLSEVLVECLLDWNLDRKLSTLTVDNCNTNDAMIGNVFDKIPLSSFVLEGSLFHMRCCAHILNLIVRDGLSTMYGSIEKVRESVAYWVATPKREEKFVETCRQLNVTFKKKLALDCKTRWNSTYLMIASALPYQEVFKRLKQREPQYKSLPSSEDWEIASEICEKLEKFYHVTQVFSGTQFPTSNVYFPKICELRLAIREWLASSNDIIRTMASSMTLKFDKYWGAVNGVMAIGAILDPRYKMKLLYFFFPRLYGSNYLSELEKVKSLFENLVAEYQAKDKRFTHHTSVSTMPTLMDNPSSPPKQDAWKKDYHQFVKETAPSNFKSELDLYLEEPVLYDQTNEDNYDILGYWKNVGVKYPILHRIARDFLAIPISTVASESAFSNGGRVLSLSRSRLHEKTVEAMMCCQSWLRPRSAALKGNDQDDIFTEDQDVDDGETSIA